MPRPSPLPPCLSDSPFATADALARGVPPRRLRAADVEHPYHGVNAVAGTRAGADADTDADATPAATADDIVERCRSYLPRLLPGQWFSHATAALLLGIPLPPRFRVTPLHISVRRPRTPPRARGVIGHKASEHIVVGLFQGTLPVCSPADAWCQLSACLSREDLVAAGDHLVGARKRTAIADLDEVRAASARYDRGRGALNRAWALERIRFGTDSRPESLLRLQLEGYGVPEPEVNPPVTVDGGRLILHPDLLLAESRIIFEYEGDGHRTDRKQWLDDIDRRELFEDAGYRVVRVTSRDVFTRRTKLEQRVHELGLVRPGR